MASKAKEAFKTLSYLGSKALFSTVMWPYFRVRVVGRGHVPREGAFILAANHFSFADPLILGAFLPRRLWFVMAEDQFEKPVVHGWSRLMDVIPMKAGAAFQISAVRKVLGRLKRGHGVAIFPEGQRSSTGGLLPAQPGIGVFASRGRVPIVPVAIVGTREVYPVGRRFPRPGRVTLFIGAPLTDVGDDPQTVADRAMGAIAGLLRENGHPDYVEGFPQPAT